MAKVFDQMWNNSSMIGMLQNYLFSIKKESLASYNINKKKRHKKRTGVSIIGHHKKCDSRLKRC